MKQGIQLNKIWADEELIEFLIGISDGVSFFSTKSYIGHADLEEMYLGLANFKNHKKGAIFDLEIGKFGSEYAAGAISVRLHHKEEYKIYSTAKCQSDFFEFGGKKVTNEGTLHFISAPLLLESFVEEIKQVIDLKRNDAYLQAV